MDIQRDVLVNIIGGLIVAVLVALVAQLLHLLPRIPRPGPRKRHQRQASATQLLRGRLGLLIEKLEKNPVEDAVLVEKAILETLVGRTQLLKPISVFFQSVLLEAKKNRLHSTRASVLGAARRFLAGIDRAHEQIINTGCEVLKNIDGELVDIIVLADFSTPVYKVLNALAEQYAGKRGSVRVYVISSDRHFISSRDTLKWKRLFATGEMARFYHLEAPIPLDKSKELFERLQGNKSVLLTGAERIYPNGRIVVFPGIRTLVELASLHQLRVFVVAESYKVQPALKDEVARVGTDSEGAVVELVFLTISTSLSLITDHTLHVKASKGPSKVKQIETESLKCCMRFWCSQIEGKRYPLGVIFDLDGTLIDSEPTHKLLYQEVAQMAGYHLSDEEYGSKLRGMTDSDTIASIVKLSGKPHNIDDLVVHKQRRYHEYLTESAIPATQGAIAFVKGLAHKGFLLAVATSATTEEACLSLKNLGLSDCISIVVSAESVQNGKPAPDIYLKAAKSLGLAPSECLVYEDAVSGVHGAIAAAMRVIGVTRSDSALLKDAGAMMVIEDFRNHELPEM
jgi:HAD superfamily hydrolase (TIGR01509 family)